VLLSFRICFSRTIKDIHHLGLEVANKEKMEPRYWTIALLCTAETGYGSREAALPALVVLARRHPAVLFCGQSPQLPRSHLFKRSVGDMTGVFTIFNPLTMIARIKSHFCKSVTGGVTHCQKMSYKGNFLFLIRFQSNFFF